MAKKAPVEVWNFDGRKLQRIEGAKLGERMVTLPNGQRWARDGHGLTGDYTESEADAAKALLPKARQKLRWARESVAEAEAALAECARVLGDKVEG